MHILAVRVSADTHAHRTKETDYKNKAFGLSEKRLKYWHYIVGIGLLIFIKVSMCPNLK